MSEDDKRAMLVVGPSLEETSTTGRIVGLLGATPVGTTRPADDRGSSRPQPESIDCIHDRLLGDLGRQWRYLHRLPDGWLESAAAERARGRLRESLGDELHQPGLWSFADPRLCRLLPLWRELLAEEEIRLHLLIPFGNVLPSNSNDTDPLENAATALYFDRLLDLLDHSEGLPRVVLSYTDLLRDWRSAAKLAAARFELEDWPSAGAPESAEIEETVRGACDRIAAGEIREIGPRPHPWAARLTEALEDACENDSSELPSTMGSLRHRWVEALELFEPELTRLHSETAALRANLRALENRLEASQRQAAELREAFATEAGDEGLEERVRSALGSVERKAEQVASLERTIEELRAQLEESELGRRRLDHRLRRTRQELRKVQSHLTRLLSGRLLRYTRGLRSIWYRLKRYG